MWWPSFARTRAHSTVSALCSATPLWTAARVSCYFRRIAFIVYATKSVDALCSATPLWTAARTRLISLSCTSLPIVRPSIARMRSGVSSPIPSSGLNTVATTGDLTKSRNDYNKHACQRAKQHVAVVAQSDRAGSRCVVTDETPLTRNTGKVAPASSW